MSHVLLKAVTIMFWKLFPYTVMILRKMTVELKEKKTSHQNGASQISFRLRFMPPPFQVSASSFFFYRRLTTWSD